ncbi:MAG: trypsin-like peptidase domain-containing protein [Roseovarius sp.]|nr:trypsin-like peptidase domain-containing protein [Roseovarius sp.]
MAPDPPPQQASIPAAINATQARRIAAHFTAGRPALSQIYGEIARRSGGRLRDFKIVALGLNETTDAFAAALLEAAKADIHRTFLTELATLGCLDLGAVIAALETIPGDDGGLDALLWPQDATGLVTLPQGWNAHVAATLDMSVLLRAVNLAARRVCLVQTGASQGTGFLIGPQTVLTNWHVMAPLLDPATGQPQPGSAQSIRCTFESLGSAQGRVFPVLDDWLVEFSPLAVSAPAPPGIVDMTTLRPHALDFCALRLPGSPGRERGYYDMTKLGTLNADTDHFFVFQHPFANPQRLAITTGVTPDPNGLDFLRHKAWTDEGSSGGLCLDQRFQPLALHHAAVTDQNGAFQFNRAVRLSAIHALMPDLGAPDPAHDRITQLSDGSRAILGRGASQDMAHEMMQNASRPILYVRGPPRSGKSFTAELIRDCTPHHRRRIVKISASEMPVEARELAALILTRAGAPDAAVAALPGADTPNGTDNAWIRSALLPALRQALMALLRIDPAQTMTLWLIIDELDIVPIPQTGARELLDALYADAEAMRTLRVVLIGLDAALPGIDQAITRVEYMDHPEQVDPDALETCLGALMAEKMLAPSPAELRRQVDLVTGVANMIQTIGPPMNRLERMSEVLAKVWLTAARQWK